MQSVTPPSQSPKTPPSVVGLIPLGFGFEFGQCLQEGFEANLERQDARWERYGKLGIDREDLRLATPPGLREAYLELIEQDINDVHTPSPSPSPSLPSLHEATASPLNTKLSPARIVRSRSGGTNLSTRAKVKARVQKKSKRPSADRTKIAKPPATPAVKKRKQMNSIRGLQRLPTHKMITRSHCSCCSQNRHQLKVS